MNATNRIMARETAEPPRQPQQRRRINVFVAPEVGTQLVEISQKNRRTQSDIVEAALLSLFSPDSVDRREAAITRRLDRQARQLEALYQELIVATESLALFIRYFMSVTPALPESQKTAARTKGAERFAAFTENLGRRLGEGKRLLGDLHPEFRPGANEFSNGGQTQATAPEADHATA